MCGRFIQCTSGARLAERFHLSATLNIAPRYNVAPSQPVGIVRATEGGGREWALARWGLIPAWAPEPQTPYPTINARAETVADQPVYRQAFRKRRCLIPAEGFYEWQKRDAHKQPYCIAPADGEPFAFAGLWERWERDGQILESCTILVTQANTVLAPIHDRMPVILDSNAETRWLDPTLTDPAVLRPLRVPCPGERLRFWPVSSQVNNPRHEGSVLRTPLATPVS